MMIFLRLMTSCIAWLTGLSKNSHIQRPAGASGLLLTRLASVRLASCRSRAIVVARQALDGCRRPGNYFNLKMIGFDESTSERLEAVRRQVRFTL
jgi:hypothetical protein